MSILDGIRFEPTSNGASVRACVRSMWAFHPERNQGQFQSTLPLNFKSIRAVQQRYSSSSSSSSSSTTPVNVATLIYIGTAVFHLYNLRHPWGFKSTTSRRLTLYDILRSSYPSTISTPSVRADSSPHRETWYM